MTKKSVLIIGSGKRVREAALPALQCLPDVSIDKIYARTAKEVTVGSQKYGVQDIEELQAGDIAAVDLIYMAVKQPGVVAVLKRLSAFDLSETDLLIETPVMPVTELSHLNLFEKFRNVWVAEDCTRLPCFDVLKGKTVTNVVLDQSGYKYHAIALLKTLTGSSHIFSATRENSGNGKTCDRIVFDNGQEARIISPRDYKNGSFSFDFNGKKFSDSSSIQNAVVVMKPVLEGSECIGFKFEGNGSTVQLNSEEMKLLGTWELGTTISAKMHDLKRAGLYRMFKDILEGKGSYRFEAAIRDMTISFYLDNCGFYRNNAFMQPEKTIGRYGAKVVILANRVKNKFGL